MAGRGSKSLDFCSEDFDPALALEDPNISLPCEDVEASADLNELREVIHSQRFTGDENVPGVLGPGGVPLRATRKTPIERNFAPEQAPLQGKQRRRRNVLTRMQEMKGPLRMLQDAVATQAVIKVYIRNDRGVRSALSGQLVAYDKHFNMVLKDVSEVFVARRHYKRHALDNDVGNFVTVADLSIKETDEDEKKALECIAAEEQRDATRAAAGPSYFRDPASKLLGEFLESSKKLLGKSEFSSSTTTPASSVFGAPKAGTATDADSTWRTLSTPGTSGVGRGFTPHTMKVDPVGTGADMPKPNPVGFQEPGPSGLQKSSSVSGTSKATAASRSQRVQERSAGSETGSGSGERRPIAEGHSTVSGAVRGKRVSDRETEFTTRDLLEAKMLSLGRQARQEYNPENYNERWDSNRRADGRGTEALSAQRQCTSIDEGSLERHRRKSRTEEQPPSGPLERTKTKLIYTQARQSESGVNVSSESSQEEDDCNRKASAGGGGGGVDTAIASKNRKRKRKKREIRKRFVKQILVRGENVVLVACSDEALRREEESQKEENRGAEKSETSK